MKKSLAYLAVGFIALGLSFSACKRGATIGTVGEKDNNPFQVFDTFAIPNQPYFFWGVFDGHFMKWVHGERSEWDTATRMPGPSQDPTVDPWDTWPVYTKNIYDNVCDQGSKEVCPDYNDDDFAQIQTRFQRNDFPSLRVEVNFFRCMNMIDTFTSVHFIEDSTDVMTLGAWPFSDYVRGEWGAQIKYTDANRDVWTTNTGSGNLNDSYFRITKFYPRSNPDTTDTFAHFTVEGEFAGRLYMVNDPAQNIAVTNSKFRARAFAIRPEGKL